MSISSVSQNNLSVDTTSTYLEFPIPSYQSLIKIITNKIAEITFSENAINSSYTHENKKLYNLVLISTKISFYKSVCIPNSPSPTWLENQASLFISWLKQHGKRIETLNLSNLNLTFLPKEIGLCTSLKYLDLSKNKLHALPKNFDLLQNLTQLDLSHNLFHAFPPSCTACTQVTNLDISSNQLCALPPEIEKFSNLKFFEVNYNLLEELPEEIGKFKHLQIFFAQGNKLSAYPKAIQNLKKLLITSFRGNPCCQED